MQKHYSYLDINLDNKNYRRLRAIQGDIKSRYILVNLYSNNLHYDLSNCTVKVYGLKEDKTIFFNNAVIKNAKKGEFEIELTNQALAVVGELKIQILILGTTGEKLSSSAFFIDVGESIINENAIESTNEFNTLLEGLASLAEYDIYKENVSEHGEILINHDEKLKEVDSQLEQIVIKTKNIVVDVCDFGADKTGNSCSANAFTNAFETLKNGGKLLIPAGNFKIDSNVIIQDSKNIKIECYGNISATSSLNHYNAFYFINCKDISITGLSIKSLRDKIEPPPKDHVRVTDLGSNITGIYLCRCENFIINNYNTENLAYDIKIGGNKQHVLDGFINKNIKIDGLNSTNSSQPIFVSGVDNIKLYNLDIKVADDLGDGDHFVYTDIYVNNVHIHNANLKCDKYFGVGFNCRTAQTDMTGQTLEEYDNSKDPHNIFINNVNMKCRSFVSVKADTNVMINNCIFEGMEETMTSSPRALSISEYGKIDIKNSNFSCLNVSFTCATGCGVINSYNSIITSNTTLIYVVEESVDSQLNFFSCELYAYSNPIFYNVVKGICNTKFLNSIIYTDYSYMFSKREINSELYVLNCKIDGNSRNNIIYNSNTVSTNVKFLGNIINGYSNIASNEDATNLVSVNNIINDVLS